MGEAGAVESFPVINLSYGAGTAAQVGTVHGGLHVSTGKVGGPSTQPRQLPADVAQFTGRAAELRRLDLLGTSAGPSVAVISGLPGIGKSALAVRWAHSVADRFSDGQLFADLGGDEPAAAATTLSAFLRALGVSRPDEWTDVAERAAHLRTLLSGRRVLMVLDNAHSAEQVRPLLPGSDTCAVVVTSRSQLTSVAVQAAAVRITLEPLSMTSASSCFRVRSVAVSRRRRRRRCGSSTGAEGCRWP
ncbi:AAA family ATPase [Lentzea guizhouensis]|uniref:AAA family ATPase n=1 Tax=Lentzea guizhouensis TaxID=1586287 RepID=UPI0014729944|nr:ATP-binding protein [Lentzea guizhouensis]